MADRAGEGAAGRQAVDGKWRVFLLLVGLTAILSYPLSVRPASSLLGDHPDIHLFMWTLAWDTHAFVHQPLAIFDTNIYYPARDTLAYSENLIGSALFAAPVLWLTDNPVLALNLVVLLTCVLCGLGAYVLARRVGIGPHGGVLAGLIFAFSPVRFFRISQLHLTAVHWIPFTLASLHAYLDGGRRRDLRLAAAFFTLQVLSSGHGAVFLVLAIAGLLAYRAVLGEPIAPLKRLRDLGVPGVLLLAPVFLIAIPYRRVQVEMGLVRHLYGDWWPTPESFLASPSRVHTWLMSFLPAPHVNETASAFLFPGFIPLLLAAAALIWRGQGAGLPAHAGARTAWRRAALVVEIAALAAVSIAVIVTVAGPVRLRLGNTLLFTARDAARAWVIGGVVIAVRLALVPRAPIAVMARVRQTREALHQWWATRRPDPTVFYGLLTLAGLLLAVGPPLGLWPLVYWLPGMNFIRVPSRFMLLALVGVAVLAGLGFERLSARLAPKRRTILAVTLGTLLVIECAGIPLRAIPYRWHVPAVDRWLARQPGSFVIAEMPTLPAEWYHTTYMLHSTAHWQKTVHGYSGLRPPLHEALYPQLRGFPDEMSLERLLELGVTYVVVHADLYPEDTWLIVDERLKLFTDRLVLEHSEGPGRVYSLRRPKAASEERP